MDSKGYKYRNFYSNELLIKLISDNDDIINYSTERLSCHFPFDSNGNVQKIINIHSYSTKANDFNDYEDYYLNKKWIMMEHMQEKYFLFEIDEYNSCTVWVTKNHDLYGGSNYSSNDIINLLLKGDGNICMLIKKEEKDFYFFYNNIDDYTKLTPMRLIRSLFMYEYINHHYIYFHSAAIRYKNLGVLVCGASGNGKTSTLLNFLNMSDGELIANDKVFIGVKNNELIVQGWPTIVSLGVGSLKQYEKLNKYLTNIDDVACTQDLYNYIPRKEYLHMTEKELKDLGKTGNKLVISHNKLSNIFNKDILSSFKVDLIIIVNHKWEFSERKITSISENNKLSILLENRINNFSDQLEWIGYPRIDDKLHENEVFNKIILDIPMYQYEDDFKKINIEKVINEVV